MKVFICDTNNHCIRRVYYDLGEVVTPVIKGIPVGAGQIQADESQTKIASINQREGSKGLIAGEGETNLKCEGGLCVVPDGIFGGSDEDDE